MSLSVLNEQTVTAFVDDSEAFDRCTEEAFKGLDVDGDGVLSRAELLRGFEGLRLFEADSEPAAEEVYDAFFNRFDSNGNGTVDLDEFKSEMRESMLAVARGIGESPIVVAIDSDSFLMRAVEHHASRTGHKLLPVEPIFLSGGD